MEKKTENPIEIAERLMREGKLTAEEVLEILVLDPISQLTALSLADR